MNQERPRSITVRTYKGDGIPNSLIEAADWMQSRLNEIPEEYRASAKFEAQARYMDYNCAYLEVEITYERPETFNEADARAERERQQQERLRSRDLEDLARLRAKYGAGG